MAALLRLVNEGMRSISTARQLSVSRLSLLSLNNISRSNINQINSNHMTFFERPLSYFSDSDAEKAKPFGAHLSRYREYVLHSAHFFVNFHNQNQNAQHEFVRVLKADRLRVAKAGSLLYITLEVNDATGKSSFYRTRVHYWPWEKKRQVDAWERVETPSFDHLQDEDETDDDDDESRPGKSGSPFSYFSDTEADDAYPEEVDDETFVLSSARYAVNFHNRKQNAQLEFVRVIKANMLRVGGLLLYILLEVNDAGKLHLYRTRIFYRPWIEKRYIHAWERVEATSFDLEENDDDGNKSCYEKYVLRSVPFDPDRVNHKQLNRSACRSDRLSWIHDAEKNQTCIAPNKKTG